MSLQRFIDAQEHDYSYQWAAYELGQGRKQSCWMWWIFPQLLRVGLSKTSTYYALKNLEEARAYLAHPVLGERLRHCCELVLATPAHLGVGDIFGLVDANKLHSCMSLFAFLSPRGSVFDEILAEFEWALPHKTEKPKPTVWGDRPQPAAHCYELQGGRLVQVS